MALIATAVFVLGILGLFGLDRDSHARTSKALWIPVIWLSIAGSRNVGEWVQVLKAGSSSAVGADDVYVNGNLVDEIALGGLIGLAILVLLARGGQVRRLILKNGPIFLYLFYCGASILWSDYPAVVFRRWNRALGDFVMIMVVLTDPDRQTALKRLLARVGFVLLPVSLLFIRWYPELGRSYGMDGTPYWGGVTGGKNSLGMICLIFGLASGWRFLTAYRDRRAHDRTRRLIAHGFVFALALWLIRTVNSATSFACVILAGGVMVVTSRAAVARRPARIHLLVALVISTSVFALFFDPSGDLVGTLGRNSTLTGRTEVWSRAFRLVKNPIIGAGFESFWLGDRLKSMWKVDRGLNQAHDGYIEVYLNLGLVGVALIGAILVRGYRNLAASLRQDRNVTSLKLGYFVVAVIYNCTESGFKMMSPVWIIALLAMMIVPNTPISRDLRPLDMARAHNFFDPEPEVVGPSDVAPLGTDL